MDVWAWSWNTGSTIGVAAFTLTLVVTMIWQVRRYGSLSLPQFFGAVSIGVYGAALVWYTQLPLPDTRSLTWCEAYGVPGMQLTPFESFHTMWLRAGEIGWGAMLTAQLGQQVILNVLLMVPLGVIVRGYFHQTWLRATLTGLFVSLGIELTQATGMWGHVPCAYRLGDVDDLMTNTFGAAIGALLAPMVLFWLPKRTDLIRTRLQARPVTAGRRMTSMVINVGLISSTSWVLSGVMNLIWRFVYGTVDVTMFAWVQWGSQALVVVAVLYIPALLGHGSLGQRLAWLAPRWQSPSGQLTRGTFWQRISRVSVIGIPFLLHQLPALPEATALLMLVVIATITTVVLSPSHRAVSGILLRSETIDTRVTGTT